MNITCSINALAVERQAEGTTTRQALLFMKVQTAKAIRTGRY